MFSTVASRIAHAPGSDTTAVAATADAALVSVTVAPDPPDADDLRRCLASAVAARPPSLIVDLTAVRVCPPAVLAVLLDLPDTARAAGVPWAIVSDQPAVRRSMAVAGHTHVLCPLPTMAAARRRLDGARRQSAQGTSGGGVEEVDGYENLEPVFAEMATLDPDQPERAMLRRTVIRRSLPLADHIARKFVGRGEPYDDVQQVARVGLVLAVDRFDPDRGGRFLSFAVPTVTGEIRRHFRDHTWTMRVPRSVQELRLRVQPAIQVLSQRLGRAPTSSEIAAEIDADPADVIEAIVAANAYSPDSIDAEETEGTHALADALGEPDDRLDHIEQCTSVAPLITALGERERRMLRMRFFESMTQTQIAEHLGISQMQVSRLLTQILDGLRSELGNPA